MNISVYEVERLAYEYETQMVVYAEKHGLSARVDLVAVAKRLNLKKKKKFNFRNS